ncbi:hypothetical protein CARUB_v10009793mg [Capsella rubella]|uniref:DUF4408 domain-containing protein n=1 Tax=Capsella rubella TaxID=81985 RepID=R0IIM7_9BRAS|nr:uncharacterized protein LOC17898498 [Capsella rubella]EOA38300.1 hypothetical protein CARUB_v10009793mg [Capsella rubella]
MEAEKAGAASKTYNDPFRSILFVVEVTAVVTLLGYWCLPAMVNLLHEVVVWLDWFTFVLRNLFFVFLVVNVIIFLIYVSFCKTNTGKKKPDLQDQYLAAFPPLPRACPYDVFDIGEYNHSYSYTEPAPTVQAVKAVEESSCTCCCDREVVEVSSKSYRRTRSEKTKKTEKMVEYRRTESERMMKTASWRSQTMDGLSSEEFRMTVETFITEKKKTLLQDMDQWQNGTVPQWRKNGALQNGVFPQWQSLQWQNPVPEPQNDIVQWQNPVPEPQNDVVQWQRSRDNGSGRHRRGHRSRSHRLVGGSGSNGSYLAISN